MLVHSVLGRGIWLNLSGKGKSGVLVAVAERSLHTSLETRAARKGTRARKEKGKVKKEETKLTWFQKIKKNAVVEYKTQRPFDKSHYPAAIDDVYFYRKYQHKAWDFAEAVANHRETHHPSVYNVPNAPLNLRIDMDFRYPNRPNKCQDGWKTIVEMPHPFLLPGMVVPTILAVVPPHEPELIEETLAAGADKTGSGEIIKAIQAGEIHGSDFEYIVCHPLMITEMSVVRGLCKRNFPSSRTRTIEMDVPGAVKRLKGGLKVHVTTSDQEPDYAYIEVPIGSLDMETAAIEANFESVLRETLARRVPGKAPDKFIIQCLLRTPHSFEEFKVDVRDHILRTDVKKGGTKGWHDPMEEPEADPASLEQKEEKQAAVA